ncbi:MAG: Tfp pilus assembly protein FimT/FimU [Phycisphaerae bacterium]
MAAKMSIWNSSRYPVGRVGRRSSTPPEKCPHSPIAHPHRSAYTLVEIMLAIAILVAIAGFVVPNFVVDLERLKLPGSARRMRSLVAMVQANAAFDGVRYRIRFPMEEEADEFEDPNQPIVEREEDAVLQPHVFTRVTAPWAVGTIVSDGIRCAEVRMGRPTIELIRELENRDQIEEALKEAFQDFDPLRPPVVIDPDGTSDWVTFVVTNAPADVPPEDLADSEEYSTIEVIVDGLTGSAWLQRPLYAEELDLFEEQGWPIVLRRDFLDPRVLTEDDVLELHNIPIDGATQ